MDFSSVKATLDSKSYEKVADVCDNLMLQVAADGIAYQDDWPYAIHLLSHYYVHDMYLSFNSLLVFPLYITGHLNEMAVTLHASTVRAFFGNQYLPQSKRASLKLPRFGKSVRSSGYVTMLECTRQFVALIGVRMSKA
ncbi:hypothetical protein ACSQ67_013288 [Phaseolus vulgaris]